MIVQRLENLAFLSQCHESAELFNREYERLLALLMSGIRTMRVLAEIQAGWLKAEAEAAQKDEQEASGLKDH